jgi:starch synthase
VRATGGLDDTVINYNENTGEGTGFKFWESTPLSLYYTIGWAISTFYDRKHHMKELIQNGMDQDFSWNKSAVEYVKLYQKAIENKQEYDRLNT